MAALPIDLDRTAWSPLATQIPYNGARRRERNTLENMILERRDAENIDLKTAP
jgi:hypothetical protein